MKIDAHIHLCDLDHNTELSKNTLYLATTQNLDEFSQTIPFYSKYQIQTGMGIHPWNIDLDRLDIIHNLACKKKITFIGECGYDFHRFRREHTLALQKEAFEAQIGIAQQHNLPLVIHAVKSMPEVMQHAEKLSLLKGVIFHSFNGTGDEAAFFLKKGVNALFSFGTSLVKKQKKILSLLKSVPLSHICFETDAPYLPPRGYDVTPPSLIDEIYALAARELSLSPELLENVVENSIAELF